MSLYPPCDVALLAGQGKLPRLVLEGMHAAQLRVLVMALDRACDPSLKERACCFAQLHPAQLGKAVRLIHRCGASELTLAGRVPHELLLKLRPWQLGFDALKLWWSLPDTRADSVLGALVDYFQKEQISVAPLIKYLKNYLMSRPRSTQSSDSDLLLGIVTAKVLGSVDVGQSVVVRAGSVIALEGIEGTDRCLERAIALGSRGAILVKMAKPAQDLRFDLPTVGAATVKRLIRGQFRALVVEGDKTLCVDPEALEELHRSGIELLIATPELIAQAFERFPPRPFLA